MNILRRSASVIWHTRGEYHVLTYAEDGFSPLDMHGRPWGIDKQQQAAFCETVNNAFKTGTLFPQAPMSAVPRALIRDSQDAAALASHIADFLRINLRTIKATNIICDFRTPKVAAFVVVAIETAMASPDASIIEEVVIVES